MLPIAPELSKEFYRKLSMFPLILPTTSFIRPAMRLFACLQERDEARGRFYNVQKCDSNHGCFGAKFAFGLPIGMP